MIANCPGLSGFAPEIVADGFENITLPEAIVIVTVCGALAGKAADGITGFPVGIPKDSEFGDCETACACAGCANNNKRGLQTNTSANFFMFMTGLRTSII